MKVSAIKETKNIPTMKVDELIGSLLTFEITINDKYEEYSKCLAFKVDIIDHEDQASHDIDDNLTKSIVMLVKHFSKIVIRFDRRIKNNVSSNIEENQQNNSKVGNFQRRGKEGERLYFSYTNRAKWI